MTDAFTAWTLAALAGAVAGASGESRIGWVAACVVLLVSLACGMRAVASFDGEEE